MAHNIYSTVQIILSDNHLNILGTSKGKENKLSIVMFHLNSAIACQGLDKTYVQMSEVFKTVDFYEANPDRCSKSMIKYGITDLPTVVLIRCGEVLGVVKGAFPSEWEKLIRQHLTEEDLLGMEKEGTWEGPGGRWDLHNYIEFNHSSFSNVEEPLEPEKFFAREAKAVSDVDEEIIMDIRFNQSVMIESLKIKAPAENGPSQVQVFLNPVKYLDFDDVAKGTPVQKINLTASDLEGKTAIPLKSSRFKYVGRVVLYFPGNLGGQDKTTIDYISFFGIPSNRLLGVNGVKSQIVYLE